jgi:putative flippase GtrA
MGYIISLIIAYLLNAKLNFKQKPEYGVFIKFAVSYIPNFIIQNVVVIIFYNWLGWHRLIAYVMAAILGIPVTFLLVRGFAFRKDNSSLD